MTELPTSTAQAINLNPPDVPVPASFFGMHIHDAATGTPWPPVPFATWRLWDARVTWFDLEPRNGQWKFDLLDQYIALADQHHVEVSLPLGMSPTWASARPEEKSPYFPPGASAGPKYIEDWRKYVATVATRYKGRVRSYEVWNEPNLPEYWTGTTKDFVTLMREAYSILKDIDPSVTMSGPSATNRETGPTWLDGFLAAGGGNVVDVIAQHLYVYPSAPEGLIPLIERVRRIMAKYGLADRPLWNTEMGWSAPTVFSTDEEAAAYVARAYILSWIAGVTRCYWYAWDNQEWATLWLTEKDNKTLKPAAVAYGEVQRWLVGTRMQTCTFDGQQTYICQLVRPGGNTAWVVWNPESTLEFLMPVTWNVKHIRDLTGVSREWARNRPLTIGPAPLLLDS